MTRYTIGISPGKLTGIAIYDREENNLMTYVDFEDTEIAFGFMIHRLNEIDDRQTEVVFDMTVPQVWFEFLTDRSLPMRMNLKKVWPSPSDIFAETGIKVSNQPLANAVTMAMEKMKV